MAAAQDSSLAADIEALNGEEQLLLSSVEA
jgi:hypothetical protein